MALTKSAATKAWIAYSRAVDEIRWRKSRGAPADVVQRAEWRAAEAYRRYSWIHAREARMYGCARDCCTARAV